MSAEKRGLIDDTERKPVDRQIDRSIHREDTLLSGEQARLAFWLKTR